MIMLSLIKRVPTSVYLVIGACAIAVILRVWLPWNAIFTGDHINFSGNDAYYQMVIIRQVFDGVQLTTPTTYANLIIGLSWLLSAGHPTFNLIEHVAAFIPVIFAAGTVIFVYFIGRLLHSHMVGYIAAFTVAILPGEWFGRSFLGAVDYHAAEVFLTTGAILSFIVMARIGYSKAWQKLLLIALFMFLAYGFILAYTRVWQGSLGFMPVFAIFAATAVLQYFQPKKFTLIIMASAAAVIVCYIGYKILGQISSFSNLIKIATTETQPGWTDYLVLLHIFLTLIFTFIYFKYKGFLRLPVTIWAIFCVAATVWQRRFDYYLTIPLSILLGFAITTLYRNISNWGTEKTGVREPAKSLGVIHE